MYAKFFRIASVILFGIFIAVRMFVENGVINDIALSCALLVFLGLSVGGFFFDKDCSPEDKKAYRKFSIGFAVIMVIWGIMLLVRYVIT